MAKKPAQSKTLSAALSVEATDSGTGGVTYTITIPRLPLPPQNPPKNQKLYERIVRKTAVADDLILRLEERIAALNLLHNRYAEREGALA